MEIDLKNHLPTDGENRYTLSTRLMGIPAIPRNATPRERTDLAQVAICAVLEHIKGKVPKSRITALLRQWKTPELNKALIALQESKAISAEYDNENTGAGRPTILIKLL